MDSNVLRKNATPIMVAAGLLLTNPNGEACVNEYRPKNLVPYECIVSVDTGRNEEEPRFSQRNPSGELKEYIKSHEGFRSRPYRCLGGYPTIGYGHRIKKDEKLRHLSLVTAEKLLEKDLMDIHRFLETKIGDIPVTQAQYDAILHFSYALGVGRFLHSSFGKHIMGTEPDAWDYAHIEASIRSFCRVNGRPIEYLKMMRDMEVKWFRAAEIVM